MSECMGNRVFVLRKMQTLLGGEVVKGQNEQKIEVLLIDDGGGLYCWKAEAV